MESKTFQAIANLFQFLLSIAMFWWALKYIILPKRRNRKGRAVNYCFRLPKGYRSLPTEGEFLDGNFTNKSYTSSIVATSKETKFCYEKRKIEILNSAPDKKTSVISEGTEFKKNSNFSWLKTLSENNEISFTMVSYFFSKSNFSIEFGCGSKTEDFHKYLKDYEELISSVARKES